MSSYNYEESSYSSGGDGGAGGSSSYSSHSSGGGGGGSYQESYSSGGGGGAGGFSSHSSGGGGGAYASQSESHSSGGGGYSSSAAAGGGDLRSSSRASGGGSRRVQLEVSGGGAGGASYSSGGAGGYAGEASGHAGALSAVEASILRSTVPIEINETEEITANGERGIYANKAEILSWRGTIPITEYKLNVDANPELITKRTAQAVTYTQEIAVRYLRPPTPPPPGEIVIKQECVSLTPPAPPLVIRQMPPRPCTPEPLVVREAPPKAPCTVGRKLITIEGRRLPPAPRKVVIERLPPLPNKPQAILIERWLGYNSVKRRVVFQKDCDKEPTVVKPRNVIVQWEAPEVVVKKECKFLGTIRANPAEYVAKYGDSLKHARDLPQFCNDLKAPEGAQLAANSSSQEQGNKCVFDLVGDVQLMKYVNLDTNDLSEYREVLAKQGINYVGDAEVRAWIQRASQEMYARSAAAQQQHGGH